MKGRGCYFGLFNFSAGLTFFKISWGKYSGIYRETNKILKIQNIIRIELKRYISSQKKNLILLHPCLKPSLALSPRIKDKRPSKACKAQKSPCLSAQLAYPFPLLHITVIFDPQTPTIPDYNLRNHSPKALSPPGLCM